MFCPECKGEYREGITKCASCGVDLVAELPPPIPSQYGKFVTIYEVNDPIFIAFVKSVLDAEGIRYFSKGEHLQELFGAGRLGLGGNPVAGPVQIQVAQQDAARAGELIRHLKEGNEMPVDDENDEWNEPESPKPVVSYQVTRPVSGMSGFLKGLLVGLLVAGAVFFIYDWRQRYYSGTYEYDFNNDSKMDAYYTYEKGVLVKYESDRNFDGKIDNWTFYAGGLANRAESDEDFDGRIDSWWKSQDDNISQAEIDTNRDNKPDVTEYYKHGVLAEQQWLETAQSKVFKKTLYQNGVKREELIDEDLDGKFDRKVTYDYLERPVFSDSLQ